MFTAGEAVLGYHLPKALIVGDILWSEPFLLPSSAAAGSCCQHIEKRIEKCSQYRTL